MFEPHSYGVALAFMLVSMTAWGSWANTLKMAPRLPFQLFYWDYVVGVVLITLVWGVTLGSHGGAGQAFFADLGSASPQAWLYAMVSGAIFNVANLLLVAAIAMAGLAVAFPVGIGLALVVGVALNYWLAPAGQPALLGGGVALVLLAIGLDALAHRRRGQDNAANSRRGLLIALASGLLMGIFYPLIVKAQARPSGLGPYGVALAFALGVVLCAIPVNSLLMRRPLTPDAPVTFAQYRRAALGDHLWGVAGGAIWGTGLSFSLVAASAQLVGPAVSYAVGQGATMISAAWGIFIWKEFAAAPLSARKLLPPMFVLFLAGLALIAIAPLYEVYP